jgi:3-phenylpropionate/trans-cinnamate dioxygenase ferredoxin subunit
MTGWIQVADEAAVPPGEGRTVDAGRRPIALFNDDGIFLAIDDVCPHQGASLGEGTLHEGRVICPLHSWVFELRTGRCPRETHEPVATYPARCQDGKVEVLLPTEENE